MLAKEAFEEDVLSRRRERRRAGEVEAGGDVEAESGLEGLI